MSHRALNNLFIITSLAPLLTFIHSSPQAMCAELAHDHALEDLHKITEHTSDPSDPVRGM